MKIKLLKLIVLVFIFPVSFSISTPSTDLFSNEINFQSGDNPFNVSPLSIIIRQTRFNGNNMDTWVWNTGVFNQDVRVNNTPGLMWPKGSNKFAVFTTGLSIGAYVNNALRQAAGSYKGEYAPGYIINGVAMTDSRFRIYTVKRGDNALTNPDYASWGDMIPFGAPYVDVNNNGIYDPGIDTPGIKDAAQTLFICLTDGFPETHTSSEGFGGGTLPLFAEVHLTAWCYDNSYLNNVQYFNWVIINKSPNDWRQTYFSIVADADLGEAADDYIGCDTSSFNKGLGYCYNADNQDGNGTNITYGTAPPAVGIDFHKSAVIFTGNQNDSVVSYNPPGSKNKIIKRGYKELGMSSFTYFTGTGSGGAVCEQDPSASVEAYRYQTGVKKDGTPWINPLSFALTKFCYPGDPTTITGWSERGTNGDPMLGHVNNCNGTTTGTPALNFPGDRRLIVNSGDSLLTIAPGDTQNIIMGQMIARGNSNLSSIIRLKKLDEVAQAQLNSDFAVNPNMKSPNVNYNVNEISADGRAAITLNWDNTSESYFFKDSLTQASSDNSYMKFQGYEIVEFSRFADSIPDFNKPTTIGNDVRLIKIFDIIDTVGAIIDTLPSGIFVNGTEQLLPYFVVPFSTATPPPGFPNSGIFRSYTLTKTAFPEEHGGHSELIFGQPYRFAVIAYAYRTNPQTLADRKVIFTNIDSNIITIIPQAPLAGSEFQFRNDDTLFTNRRDLGVMPIIKDQDKLKTALYKIIFNSPDTSYNIIRSENSGISFDTLFKNNKFYKPTLGKSFPDDSAKMVDGVLIKVQKILNYGVIRDTNVTRDSSQSRLSGWEYFPSANIYLRGVDSLGAGLGNVNRPFQSRRMGISSPASNTFNGSGTLLPPERVRKVTIEFSDTASGQRAYRYLSNSVPPPADSSFIPFIIRTGTGFVYQDMRKVPFKIYEIIDEGDSTVPGKRQLNCAFVENNDSLYRKVNGQKFEIGKGKINGKWDPTTFKSGGVEILYIFASDYSPVENTFYTTKNLRTNQALIDIMYVWSPMRLDSAKDFKSGDKFWIYPYIVTRPIQSTGVPLFYHFETIAPTLGNSELARTQGDMEKIRAVPNPFYGFNDIQTSSRFITFTRLPVNCTIKIFTLSGNMVNDLKKNSDDSFINWDIKNFENGSIASGVYIALIEAPGIGRKIIKLAILTSK